MYAASTLTPPPSPLLPPRWWRQQLRQYHCTALHAEQQYYVGILFLLLNSKQIIVAVIPHLPLGRHTCNKTHERLRKIFRISCRLFSYGTGATRQRSAKGSSWDTDDATTARKPEKHYFGDYFGAVIIYSLLLIYFYTLHLSQYSLISHPHSKKSQV